MDADPRATLRVLTWNLFHGRDRPPDPALLTWRSRLLRRSERNATHLQVNRDLLPQFTAVLAAADWDLALLQEVPPRWAAPLAAGCEAAGHRALTSRNSLAPLRGLAARLNPDLVASNEGGSNLTLVRTRAGAIVERRELTVRASGEPERRALGFVRVRLAGEAGDELCAGNLHASAGPANRGLAEEEVRAAAERCIAWARGSPIVLGGDLNLRPRETGVYDELARNGWLARPTAPDGLDHLLARDLEPVAGPRTWAPREREIGCGGLAIRLSDHAPVEAAFALQGGQRPPADPGATGPRVR